MKKSFQRRDFLKLAAAASTGLAAMSNSANSAPQNGNSKTNIIFILADDMGYGDLSGLNPQSKIQTPHMDRIINEGVTCTNAHSNSAVCTPTRYGVLTGRYAWRTHLKSGVLWGWSVPLIEEGRMTVASMLKQKGYHTGCVGKWHLGLGWRKSDGTPTNTNSSSTPPPDIDYSVPIQGGPKDVGFDYSWIIPASLDMVPYCYIENNVTIEAPTDNTSGMPYPAFYRGGPIAPGFVVNDVMATITQKAADFIDDSVQNQPDKPFFLYFPLTAPHTPWAPPIEFQGQSEAGVYGDFVMQVDWTVGQILSKLDEHPGMADNTLIIVSSDNGSHIARIGNFNNGNSDGAQPNFGHDANHIYRGQKADAWEGGHRVPFIARWPKEIKAKSNTDETICLTDLLATFAGIVNFNLPANAGEDSYNVLPALLGQSHPSPIREATIHHSISGKFAVRKGKWKYIEVAGSGGWTGGGNSTGSPKQLYDMQADPSEQTNLYDSNPEIVSEIEALLEKYKTGSRSTPMPKQPPGIKIY